MTKTFGTFRQTTRSHENRREGSFDVVKNDDHVDVKPLIRFQDQISSKIDTGPSDVPLNRRGML
jgi:hypothetical protein